MPAAENATWGRSGAESERFSAALRQLDDSHISNDWDRRKRTHRQFPVNGWATWVTLKSSHSATAGDRQPPTYIL